MSETKWTPGPWRVEPEHNCDIQTPDARCEIATTHPAILTGGNGVPAGGQCIANARLIAAAPDLYEALRDARIYVAGAYECAFPNERENDAVLAAIDAALAKARGEA